MSTNFYSKKKDNEDTHIGKRIGIGNQKCAWIWAISPSDIYNLKDIYDDYHNLYTLEEFKIVLDECFEENFDSIGKDFS